MLFTDRSEFLSSATGRLLGLDVGSKTIGLAISDSNRVIASPLETIKRKKFTKDADILWKAIEDNEAVSLVVGFPINMDGSESRTTQSVRQFIANFLKLHNIPAILYDERLSTVEAQRILKESGMSADRRDELVDKVAASVILQSFINIG